MQAAELGGDDDRHHGPPLLDAHAHIYRADMPAMAEAWHQPTKQATLEHYLSALDEAGVRAAVLAAASIYGDYNDYMIDAVRSHKHLRTTVIIPPDTDPYVLRMMKDDGVVGIRLQFRNVASPPDLTSYSYQKLFRRAADLGWHVHLHDEGPRLVSHIPHIESAGPRLVIDHFGRPASGVDGDDFQQVLRAVERGRTWVKLSGAFRLMRPERAPELAAALLEHAGAERLLWGSDWPFTAFEKNMSYSASLALYKKLVPNAQIRRSIDEAAWAFYFN